jgi:large subunit ribosomal protein L6
MRKDLERVIEIPEGMSVVVNGKQVKVTKDGNNLEKEFRFPKINLSVEGNLFKVGAKNASKRESKMIGTISAHVNNMIKGLQEEFVYDMEICNVHFPMTVKVEGDKVTIKNFLGEKIDREAKIFPNVNVNVKGNQVEIKSFDLEAAGHTATSIEKATRVKGRDKRIFQDGIFITKKPGREI